MVDEAATIKRGGREAITLTLGKGMGSIRTRPGLIRLARPIRAVRINRPEGQAIPENIIGRDGGDIECIRTALKTGHGTRRSRTG